MIIGLFNSLPISHPYGMNSTWRKLKAGLHGDAKFAFNVRPELVLTGNVINLRKPGVHPVGMKYR